MDDNAAKVIVTAIERELFALPASGRDIAFFNAVPLAGIAREWRDGLICEQGFRPSFLDLGDRGYQTFPLLTGKEGEFSAAIVLAGRNRRANEAMIARAWSMLPDGAPILVAGANTDGVKTLRKRVSACLPVDASLAKHHGAAFVIGRRGANPFPDATSDDSQAVSPAMFSASAVDAGSQLLAGFLDDRIAGDVADFGAGSGFLSAELLARGGAIGRLDLYEADFVSLETARRVLTGARPGIEIRFFWTDLLRESAAGRYDWIVMNPPFHRGRAAEPEIGAGLIAVAAASLKSGGHLLMVANRQLPYEAALKQRFVKVDRLVEEAGYKVVEATVA